MFGCQSFGSPVNIVKDMEVPLVVMHEVNNDEGDCHMITVD